MLIANLLIGVPYSGEFLQRLYIKSYIRNHEYFNLKLRFLFFFTCVFYFERDKEKNVKNEVILCIFIVYGIHEEIFYLFSIFYIFYVQFYYLNQLSIIFTRANPILIYIY
jgi:hypothetical protein